LEKKNYALILEKIIMLYFWIIWFRRKLLCINFEIFNLWDNIEQKKNQNDMHSTFDLMLINLIPVWTS
jgi:cell division protein FtsL